MMNESKNADASNETINNHNIDIVKKIYEMFQQSEFCDAVLIINNIRYNVNSIILATCGKYYETALKKNIKEFTFNYEGTINPVIVSNFFKLIHAGSLDIHTTNLEDSINLAKFLKADISLIHCFKHYINNLSVDNALIFYNIILKCNNGDVYVDECKGFIINKFLDIVDKDYFSKIDFEVLSDVLSSNDLLVKYEKQVFHAVKLWLNSNQERNEYTCSILLKIRFPFLTPEYFVKEVMPFLDRCDICTCILKEFSEWHLSPTRRKRLTDLNIYKPPRKNTLALMFVGSMNEYKNCIFTYDPDTESTKLFMDFKNWLDHDFSTVIHNELFIIAKRGTCHMNKSWKINLQSKTISTSDICTSFDNFEAVEMDNYLYVCGGGHSTYDNSDIVVKWNLLDQTKELVKPMCQRRAFCRGIECNNKLYIFGGKSDKHNILNSGEIYDPETDEWMFTAAMHKSRYLFGIALLGKHIYVIGGDENGSAERFDTNNETWELIPSLPKASLVFCATSFRGSVYCLGNRGNWKYSPSNNVWEEFLPGISVSSDSKLFCVPSFHDEFF